MASNDTTDRLTALPPELLLDIMSLMPVRALVRLRRINKTMQIVIDTYECA